MMKLCFFLKKKVRMKEKSRHFDEFLLPAFKKAEESEESL